MEREQGRVPSGAESDRVAGTNCAPRDLSIVTLAKDSGGARATLTKLEERAGNPTIDTLYALADTLGVTLGDLIGEPNPARVCWRCGPARAPR
jgi:DNA-binding Xre family transcriptional regulator